MHTFAMDVTDDASMVAGVNGAWSTSRAGSTYWSTTPGYGSYGAVEDVPIDEARRQFEVNVFGLARLTQLVAADHARAGQRPDHQHLARSAGSSTSRWAPGTTPPSSPSRASATACASSSRRSASTWSSSSPARSSPSGTPSPATAWSRPAAAAPTRSEPDGSAQTMERGDTGWAGSSPDVVARKIVKAATTAHPKARYPVGSGAGTIVLARRLLPDRGVRRVIEHDVPLALVSRRLLAQPPQPTKSPSPQPPSFPQTPAAFSRAVISSSR